MWNQVTACNIARDEIANKSSDELRTIYHEATDRIRTGKSRIPFETPEQAEAYRLVAFETLESRGETVT